LYDKFWIPNDAKYFAYSNDRKHSIGAFTAVNNKGDINDIQGFATGLIYSDQITVEYYLPKEVESVGIISIAYVVHGYKHIFLPNNEKDFGDSGNCNININCIAGNNWQDERNAVAMILVDGNRYCTGSLVNTTANDNRPLFLTADHCLGGWANDVKHDAITAPNLSHWTFYWHYEAPGCANALPTILSTSGATVVANNSVSDFALLRLAENPLGVVGITSYYLGWDRSGNAGIGGVGIHHPSGDIKKISAYTIAPQSTDYLSNTANINATHWRIIWALGTTEGGSSGSSLLNNNHHIIGQLHGGYASCFNINEPDWYGKFSVSWTGNGAMDSRRRLRDWLDPIGTNPTTLDGRIGSAISGPTNICGTISIYGLIGTHQATSWSITPNNAFDIVWDATSATVTAPVLSGQTATLTAVVNNVNVTYHLQACNTSIAGPSTLCAVTPYTSDQNALTMWSVEPVNAFFLEADFSSATVTPLGFYGQVGTLTATGAGATFTKAIQACNVEISGPTTLCTTGVYTLDNNYTATSWTVAPSSAFTVTASNAASATVKARGLNGQTGTLTAVVNGVNITKIIQACEVTISGPSTVCADGVYELDGHNSADSWIIMPSGFTIDYDATSATVTATALNGQIGYLTAIVDGIYVQKNIYACNATISGPSTVCGTTTYTLSNVTANSWTVTPSGAFSITASDATSATVIPLQFSGLSGTLTATVLNGITVNKEIANCLPAISGPNPLCESCTGNYYIDNLPADVNAGTWTLTNNNHLQVYDDGINGCQIERVSFFDGSETVYPSGETELRFTFYWNSGTYSFFKEITFGALPKMVGIFETITHKKALYTDEHDIYVLELMRPYYFNVGAGKTLCNLDYRWVITPEEGQTTVPNDSYGRNTQNAPIHFEEPGTYTLSLSVTDDCGLSEKLQQTLYVAPMLIPSISPYTFSPNPFTSHLTFTRILLTPCYPLNVCDNSIVIYSIPGGTIAFNQSCYDFCAQSFSINVWNLMTGWYVVCMIQNGQIIQSATMIKL